MSARSVRVRLIACSAVLLVADVADAQTFYFGRDNRSATGTGAATVWTPNATKAQAARTAFQSGVAGTGTVQSSSQGFESIGLSNCTIVGSQAGSQCASGAALSGIAFGGVDVTMDVTGDARTNAWGPIVTEQGFTYKDPNAALTAGAGAVRVDAGFGHYGVDDNGVQDADGQYLRLTSLPNSAALGGLTTATLSFDRMLTSLGFWGTDVNQPVSTVTFDFFRSGSALFSYTIGANDFNNVPGKDGTAGNGNVYYFGAISEVGFDRLDITTSSVSIDGHAIDNLQVSTVPEPASLALLGTGLAGVALARRRRRTAPAAV